MWFSRTKKKTRRSRRTERLSVRTSARGGPRTDRRPWRVVILILLLAAAVGGGGTLWKMGRRVVTEGMDEFQLRNLIVMTDGVLSRSEILQTARVEEGVGLLTLDLPQLQRRLMRHPRIASAEFKSELPDILRIVIRERVPVARIRPSAVAPADVYYLVDEAGYIMMPFSPGAARPEVIEIEAGLPTLLGAPSASLAQGAATTDPNLIAALRLLSAYDTSPVAALTDLLTVDISRPGGLDVMTSQGSQITFALRDFDPMFQLQVRNWLAVHQQSVRQGRVIGTLDLSVTNNAPLRWLESTEVEPQSGPVQPTHQRLNPRNS